MRGARKQTRALSWRLAQAFVCGGKAGRIHASFVIGLVSVALTVAFLILTFGIYDSYAAKLEAIALSVYPHVVVIDEGGKGPSEPGSAPAHALSACERVCAGEVVLRRNDDGTGGRRSTPVTRLEPLAEAVSQVDPSALVAPLIFDEANLTLRLPDSGAESTVQRLRVLGIEMRGHQLVPQVDRFIPRDLLDALTEHPDSLLLSASLGRALGVERGAIEVLRTDGTARHYQVAGTFSLGFHSMAKNLVITSLVGAQALLAMNGKASYFGITLEDPYAAERVRQALRRPLAATHFAASDWMGIASGDFANIRLFRWILMVVLGMSLVITVLGIRNTLTIVTVERRRQIGILRAVGLHDGPIRRIFLWIALGLGMLGTLLGLPIGTLASTAFGRWLDRALADLLPVQGVEVVLQPVAMAQIAALVLAACAITALVSVRRALQLDPVACLAAE